MYDKWQRNHLPPFAAFKTSRETISDYYFYETVIPFYTLASSNLPIYKLCHCMGKWSNARCGTFDSP